MFGAFEGSSWAQQLCLVSVPGACLEPTNLSNERYIRPFIRARCLRLPRTGHKLVPWRGSARHHVLCGVSTRADGDRSDDIHLRYHILPSVFLRHALVRAQLSWVHRLCKVRLLTLCSVWPAAAWYTIHMTDSPSCHFYSFLLTDPCSAGGRCLVVCHRLYTV